MTITKGRVRNVPTHSRSASGVSKRSLPLRLHPYALGSGMAPVPGSARAWKPASEVGEFFRRVLRQVRRDVAEDVADADDGGRRAALQQRDVAEAAE